MAYKRQSPMPVAEGGTGDVTLAVHGVLLGNSTSAINVLSPGLTGQVLTGVTGADPSWQLPGGGLTWALATVDASLVVNHGYIANKAGLLTMTLPATAAIGDIIEITNMNTAIGWKIAQNANQYIRHGATLTTVGVAGYLQATALGDSVKMVCMVAGASTGWICTSTIGNITVN